MLSCRQGAPTMQLHTMKLLLYAMARTAAGLIGNTLVGAAIGMLVGATFGCLWAMLCGLLSGDMAGVLRVSVRLATAGLVAGALLGATYWIIDREPWLSSGGFEADTRSVDNSLENQSPKRNSKAHRDNHSVARGNGSPGR
jgi:hypothetical protein